MADYRPMRPTKLVLMQLVFQAPSHYEWRVQGTCNMTYHKKVSSISSDKKVVTSGDDYTTYRP